jgi:hypothetical protein
LDEDVCVLVQNYFPCGTAFFNPCRGVAVSSPICNNLAEISLQTLEKVYVRNDPEGKTVVLLKIC